MIRDLAVGDMCPCVCGESHVVEALILDRPLVYCPWAPEAMMYLVDTDYAFYKKNAPQA